MTDEIKVSVITTDAAPDTDPDEDEEVASGQTDAPLEDDEPEPINDPELIPLATEQPDRIDR